MKIICFVAIQKNLEPISCNTIDELKNIDMAEDSSGMSKIIIFFQSKKGVFHLAVKIDKLFLNQVDKSILLDLFSEKGSEWYAKNNHLSPNIN